MTGLTVAALFWAVLPPAPAEAREPKGIELLESIQNVFVDIADLVQRGVVSVSPTEAYSRFTYEIPLPDGGMPPDHPNPHMPHGPASPPDMDQIPGNGSGIIIDPNGHVVTNAHVVGGAEEMTVRLRDGRKFLAKVVGKDVETDLAVLRLNLGEGDSDTLPTLPLGDSDTVRQGQWTIAVGDPFGLERTVTVGIVSAVGREGVNLTRYENFIQTDAPINPGNSGGPLFNIHGEVVGVATAIMSYAQGIGFAIPSNMVKRIVDQLIENGHVERGWLGIGIQEISEDLAESFQVSERGGVLVNDVFPGQPAERTGIRPGDIILTVNDHPVSTPNTLARLVAGLGPDGLARLTYLRDGSERQVDVVLARREREAPAPVVPEPPPVAKMLGIDLQTLTPELAQELGTDGDGVVVSRVDTTGTAYASGIREGDVVREANRKPVASVEAFNKVVESQGAEDKVLLRITNARGGRYIVIPPAR
ncbi:MAG: Do family serine endopeptidase [Leptospirillia bacterium]